MNDQAAAVVQNDDKVTTIVAATPKKDTVQGALEAMKSQFAMVLPKFITPDRMVRIALTACQNNPKLLQADRKSFLGAVMRSAQLGLEPDGVLGQAYLIPFNKSTKDAAGKWSKKLEVQFIAGYKGLIDLARRSGEVSNIIAKEVCEKDTFKISWHLQPPFVHEQPSSGDRGKVIGFWAMANFINGGYHWDYMPVDEVLAVRNSSSGWTSAVEFNKTKDSPWEKHFNEMGKKTAIRRIAKYLPMSVQKAVITEDLADSKVSFHENDFGEIVIDNESGDVIDGNPSVVKEPEQTGNEGVKNSLKKKKAKDAGADPDTGEIKQAEPEAEQPEPTLETLGDVKQAASVLILALEAAPAVLRGGLFVKMHGMAIVDNLRRFGEGLLVSKIKALGIALPENGA